MIKKCQKCNIIYESSSLDQKICFPCYKKINNLREIQRSEVLVDIDDRTLNGSECVSVVSMALFNEGYNFSLWFAEGQKQPHIHIKNIPHIAKLTDQQLKEYKRLFLEKYIPKDFWNEKIPDFSLCEKGHLIAEENKPHFKYKTLKTLRSEFNTDKNNFCEVELLEKVKHTTQEYKPIIKGSGITAKITEKINIKDIARQFGLSLHGSKTLCPFHPDGKTESLVFYENQGRFHCFGCGEDGNLIKFYAMLKKLNPSFKFNTSRAVAVAVNSPRDNNGVKNVTK